MRKPIIRLGQHSVRPPVITNWIGIYINISDEDVSLIDVPIVGFTHHKRKLVPCVYNGSPGDGYWVETDLGDGIESIHPTRSKALERLKVLIRDAQKSYDDEERRFDPESDDESQRQLHRLFVELATETVAEATRK